MTTNLANRKSKVSRKKGPKKQYLTKVRLKTLVTRAFSQAHETAMQNNGFVVVFHEGKVVKKFQNGSIEILPATSE